MIRGVAVVSEHHHRFMSFPIFRKLPEQGRFMDFLIFSKLAEQVVTLFWVEVSCSFVRFGS
jgi:hypothetical protein